jgi:hypothetical protein
MKFISIPFAILFSLSSYAETTGEEIWRDFASPVMTDARTPLLVGTGATLLVYGFKYELGDKLQESWKTRQPLGESSKFGDVMGQLVPNLLYSAGMAISGWGYDNEKSKARAILMLKATAYSGIVVTAAKLAFREPRPDSGNLDAFPSGHATTAFAFAAVVGAEHEWYYGAAAYSLATFVAASRINDNMHQLHDVVGGATLGLAYGLGLYYRSHQEIQNTFFQVLPTEGLDGMILTATHEF